MKKPDGPLTAKQLVRILIIAGVVIALILNAIHSQHELTRSQQVFDCTLDAPATWPCELLPTGYPQPQSR